MDRSFEKESNEVLCSKKKGFWKEEIGFLRLKFLFSGNGKRIFSYTEGLLRNNVQNRSVSFMKDCPICRFFESSSSVQVLGTFGEFSVRHSEAEKRLPGYLYIEPKPHWTSYSDWNPESYSDFGNALRFATNWIYERHSPLKVYTVTVSEMVPHMHFHLIPRYTEDSRGVDYIRLALQGQLPE